MTHKSGLALSELVACSDDPRGPRILVDNQDPFMKVFVAVNFTLLMVVCG